MKLRFFVLLSIMLLGCYGLADAQMVSLDHTDGLIDADHLETDAPVTFYIRFTGDDGTHSGITNAFRVFSEDGANWTPLTGDTLGTLGKAQFDGGFFFNPFGITGSNADTLGFGAFRFFGPGLPANFDEVVYSLDIGPIATSEIGKTICLDSAYYPPSGVWKWAGPDVYPDWDGPHCFTVGPPAECEVVVTAPAGGETWTAGTTQDINYTTTDCADCGTVDISYSDEGGPFIAISTGSPNTGTFSWTVPDVASSEVVVKVCCPTASICAESGAFTIVPAPLPEIVSVDPNTGVQCDVSLVVTITGTNTDWQAQQGSDVITVNLTHSSGSPTFEGYNLQPLSTTSIIAEFIIPHNALPGTYDVTVDSPTADPDVLENGFTVTVAPAANIVVDPLELNFDAADCAPNLGLQQFSVASEGCNYDFTVSADVDWLSFTETEATTNAFMEVEVRSDLMPGSGTHTATITVTAPGALNSPQEIAVTLVVPDDPLPGGLEMNARIQAIATGGAQDDQTVFGTGNAATDCYDAGIDEFEPPAPPGDFVRAYFNHPEWDQLQNEFNSDIRSTFSTLCKDYVLTVQTNVAEEITLSIPAIVNPGCYKISLLSADGSSVLVDNFEADSFTFLGSATHVFRIRVCAGGGGTAPSITCPGGDVEVNICGPGEVCIDLPVANYETVGSSGGATWTDGSLCFTATEPGLYVFGVLATNSCGEDYCRLEVNVSMGAEPVIECPDGELAAERCGEGEVCVPLAIAGADSVNVVGGATWADGQLCFETAVSDVFIFNVTAYSDCGEATCEVAVNTTINDAPVIACPPDTIRATHADQGLCIALAITGADAVELIHEQAFEWASGELCFDLSSTGTFDCKIIATNDCGVDTCDVVVMVGDCPPPSVQCPAEPLNVEQCVLEPIQIPMAISGQTDLWVSEPNTWADGILTIVPSIFGSFHVQVRAGNDCGITECEVIVNFTETPEVAIECPVESFQNILCEPQEICIDLPITNADEVVVDGEAAWADGQLCFTGEPNMGYSFTVTASNACGEATCVVNYNIDYYDEPVAAFTADPTEGTVPLEVNFTNSSFVDTEGADYLWDFGDGSSSTEENPPAHSFETIGCFEVSLTVTDDCGRSASATETICVLDDQIVTPTDRWINIYCAEPMLEGVPLSPGDFITAYDPDGVLCGMGQVQPDGSYGLLLIYADDIYTPDTDEGAEAGDLITLQINGVPVATDPALFWTENGAVFMVCDFTAESCLTFDLDAGWHLISWNVAYAGAVNEAIADFAECVDVVLSFDRGGLTYDPMLPEFSTLSSVDFYHGYWLRLSCPASFDICGGIISPNDAIQVYSGWNLVSYWPQDILPVEDGFASLLATDNLLVAYGYDGGASDYIPGDPFHQSLDYLYPSFGYWAKVKNDDMLVYPGFSGGPAAAPRVDNQRSLATSVGVNPSRNWMSVYGANLEVDGMPVRSGSTVEIFTENNVLCGSGVYNDGILKFTSVYGYDSENDSYPKDGDQLSIRIDGERVDSDLTYNSSGARVALAGLSAAALLPDAYSMAQNYPNPFNPSTTISFNLPSAGNVELAVFNVLGQKVTTILSGHFEAGTHEAEWSGTDENGSAVGSGIYFYRITTSDFDQTKKMILMK